MAVEDGYEMSGTFCLFDKTRFFRPDSAKGGFETPGGLAPFGTRPPGAANDSRGGRHLGAKMGRPTSGAEPLTERVAFRLTAADYSVYKEKVSASGLKPSDFFRRCVLTNRTSIVARPVIDADLRQVLFLLARAGNKINQIAFRANADHAAGIIGDQTYRDVLEALVNLRQDLKDIAHVNQG